MKKRNKKTIIISIVVILSIIFFLALMVYLNNSQNNITFLEKKWMDNNSNNIIDVYVEKDLPIFSTNGNGIYYSFVESLGDNTGLTFNINSVNTSPIFLGTKKELKDTDIIVYKDHYVLLSQNKIYISDISQLGSVSIGILNDELSYVSNNLTNYPNIEYKTYEKIEDLRDAFNEEEVNYIIVPLYENINYIIEKSYDILYHFDSLNKYYVISFNTDSKELISIVNKFFRKWNNKLEIEFNDNLANLYYNIKKYTEIEKESITNEDFVVGYIKNIPFEGKINTIFSGVTGKYLSKFADLTGATYKYVEYSNLDKLKKAVDNKKVDIVYNAYGINNSNYVNSNYIGSKNLVVLVPNSSDVVINSMYDLSGKTVTTLKNRSLKNIYSGKNIFNIEEVDSIKDLLKLKDKEYIFVEKEVYDYYKTNMLKNYKIAFIGTEYIYDSFLLNNSNNAFNNLFIFYMNTLSAKQIVNESVNQSLIDSGKNIIISFIIDNVFYLIVALIVIGYIVYKYTGKVKLSKKIKKEDKLLYLDVMTNLKNRNYLNDNIEYWEKNVVFPQAIIILDLNDIKTLNDKHGHEAGDEQIKACANVLIKTQRENSEIMRTDGNEFTIYLIGYEEKVIVSFIHKLNKELKNALPYKEYGVAIGYSMINDEIKTIDDAINESLIMVRENKEIIYEKK